MLSMIAAVANGNVIGKNNGLIWRLPEDLKRFRTLTLRKTIIMGRKTFESLGKVLPNRDHVVLTQSQNYKIDDERVKVIHDIKQLENYIQSEEECFVIGGQAIYTMLLNKSNRLYITRIYEDFEGDTYFPSIDENKWAIEKKEKGLRNKDNPYDYEYINYTRKVEE